MSQLDFFQESFTEVDCIYNEEKYSVRDNGQVLRHPRAGGKPRPNDNLWTFGKVDTNGYLALASISVHRIVAAAFHGAPPTKWHVADHIDTNRQNNRPDNLRWLTRLENILLNPITAKRIAKVCGNVEAFLADPAKFKDLFLEPNLGWMCSVSKEDAQKSLERLLDWANKDEPGSDVGYWVMNREFMQYQEQLKQQAAEIIAAITPNAAQRDWKVPSEFPYCPQEYVAQPIPAYAELLEAGAVFCVNNIYSSLVFKSEITNNQQSIYVITESTEGDNAIKRWGLAKITFENELFVHTSLGQFFEQNGAEKYFCLGLGLEWTGGNVMDDYC